jgi:hypothetical protein
MNIELGRKCACRKRRGEESRNWEEKREGRGAVAGANAAFGPLDD